MAPPTPADLQARLLATGDEWTPGYAATAELNPDYLSAYLDMASVPLQQKHLTPKVREFVHITLNAATTHLHAPGVQAHIRAALAAGASVPEIMEVLELASTVGIHAANVGMPVLMDVLKEEGLYTSPSAAEPLDPRRQALKDAFTRNRGYWHETWEAFLELDPGFFDAYMRFSSRAWTAGSLEPKVKEFVYCAFDCAAQHLYVPGLKLHIRNALRYGATVGELCEILEIASCLGVQAVTLGAPMLLEEARKGK